MPVLVCHDEVVVERDAEKAAKAKIWLEKAEGVNLEDEAERARQKLEKGVVSERWRIDCRRRSPEGVFSSVSCLGALARVARDRLLVLPIREEPKASDGGVEKEERRGPLAALSQKLRGLS